MNKEEMDIPPGTVTAESATSPRRALLFANVAHFYTHVIMLLYPSVVLVLELVFKRPYGELLTLLLPGYVLFGLAALPAGWISDRWSARGMLVIFFFGTGAATVMTGFARDPFELGLGLTLIGLFAAIYHPVGTGFVVRHAVNRARALGANGVFGTTGVATAAVIAGALTENFGWRMAFVIPGMLCLATGLAFVLFTDAESPRRGATGSRIHEISVDRRTALRGLVILGFTVMCAGFIAQAFLVGLPKLFAERVTSGGFENLTETTTLVTIALLIGASGQLVGARLAERFPYKTVYLAMYILLLPVAVGAAFLSGASLIVAAVLIQLFMTSSLPSENCLVAGYCPSEWHATAYGGKFVMGLGVSSLAVPMVGWIHDRTGDFWWYFIALGVFAALIILAAIFLPGRQAGRAPDAAVPSAAE